jgi:hypothetical protein
MQEFWALVDTNVENQHGTKVFFTMNTVQPNWQEIAAIIIEQHNNAILVALAFSD